ncbi:hypothetical protein Tco_1569598 [Tanacetum coccineum]
MRWKSCLEQELNKRCKDRMFYLESCNQKPTGNKRNDRISQTPSRNIKNKLEARPKKFNKKNCVVKPIHDIDVKHSLLNANFEPICATCKKSLFDGVHDMCFFDFVKECSSKKAKIVESKNANHSEPNHTWGSTATDIPSSSSLVMTGCPDCSLVSGCLKHMTGNRSQLMNFLGNVTILRVYYVEGLGHNLFSVGQCNTPILTNIVAEANLEYYFIVQQS